MYSTAGQKGRCHCCVQKIIFKKRHILGARLLRGLVRSRDCVTQRGKNDKNATFYDIIVSSYIILYLVKHGGNCLPAAIEVLANSSFCAHSSRKRFLPLMKLKATVSIGRAPSLEDF